MTFIVAFEQSGIRVAILPGETKFNGDPRRTSRIHGGSSGRREYLMLLLVFILGSSFVALFVRERWSETYRCSYCAQIQVGAYHRLRCFILTKQEQLPSEAQASRSRETASQERAANGKPVAAWTHSDHRKGLSVLLPGFLGSRAAVKSVAAVLGRHRHVAPRSC